MATYHLVCEPTPAPNPSVKYYREYYSTGSGQNRRPLGPSGPPPDATLRSQVVQWSNIRSSTLYQPLPSKHHIRVVELAKPASKDAPVEAKLLLLDLREGVRYDCLSYTWSGPRYTDTGDEWELPTKTITLDGIVIPVRRNLCDALKKLRDLPIAKLLWVDAISIHQDDVEERNAQVSTMNRIYRSAENVVVWLGSADAKTIQALDLVRKIAWNSSEYFQGARGGFNLKISIRLLFQRISEAGFNEEEIIHIVEFYLSFTWFSRIWTVQEFVLASNVCFVIGDLVVDREMMANGSAVLNQAGRTRIWSQVKDTVAFLVTRDFVKSHTFLSVGKWAGENVRNLGFEAHENRSKQATNPKDKIFGLAGISNISIPQRPFVVDYSSTVQSIFTEAQIQALMWLKGFPALGHVGDSSENDTPGLPSWVPDFTRPVSVKPLTHPINRYAAVTCYDTKFYIHEDPGFPPILVIPASRFDVVEETCEAFWEMGNEDRILEMLKLVLHPENRDSTNEEHLTNMFVQVLTDIQRRHVSAGSIRLNDCIVGFSRWLYFHISEIYWKQIEMAYEASRIKLDAIELPDIVNVDAMIESSKAPRRTILLANVISDGQKQFRIVDKKNPAAHDLYSNELFQRRYGGSTGPVCTDSFFNDWMFSCKGRRMFRTKKGYIGLGLPRIKKGDTVYLLQGAEVPQIFSHADQEVGNVFGYEGEAYIHGIMDGEASAELEFEEIVVI